MPVPIVDMSSLAVKEDHRAVNACAAEFLALSMAKMEGQGVLRVP